MNNILCAVFAAFLFIAPAAMAQDTSDAAATTAPATEAITPAAIGQIAEIEGTAGMIQNGQNITPQVGSYVYLNDVIETGPDSKVLVLMIDDTEVTLAENARFSIDEYDFNPDDKTNNKGRFSILRGAFIFVSGLLTKKENPDVQINTAYGSIGLRGTTVWGGELDDEYNVFVQEGEVTFATERGSVNVGQGMGTRVENERSIPARAQTWGQDRINRATKRVALQHMDQVKMRIAQMKEQHGDMRKRHMEYIKKRQQQKRDMQQDKHQQLRDERRGRNQEYHPGKEERQRDEQLKQERLERTQHEREMRERAWRGDDDKRTQSQESEQKADKLENARKDKEMNMERMHEDGDAPANQFRKDAPARNGEANTSKPIRRTAPVRRAR